MAKNKLFVRSIAALSILISSSLVLSAQDTPAKAQVYGTLELRDLELQKHVLISGFHYDLSAARFLSVVNLPRNWTITIKSNGKYGSTLEGRADTSEDYMDAKAVRFMGLEILRAREGSNGKFDVNASFTAVIDGRMKLLPVSSFGFEFNESYQRQKLPTAR